MAYLDIFCRLLIGGVFAVSAVAKIRNLNDFRNDLRGYRLIPRGIEDPAMAGVVAGELLVPILLVGRSTTLPGFLLAVGILTGFVAAMASVLRRGIVTGCGCLGRRNTTVRPLHIWRNLVLVAICLAGAAAGVSATAAVDPAFLAVLAVAACCVIATVVFVDDLAQLFSERNHS